MARRKLNNITTEHSRDELLSLAAERVKLPEGKLWLTYEPDADILYIRLKERTDPTISKDDLDKGIIYDYEGKKLVGIEILDLYGTFV